MKPKVLLLNPSINLKTQRKFVTDIIRVSFPFSLGYLAGYLLRNGDFPLAIHDDQVEDITDEKLDELLAAMDPDIRIVGITVLTATSNRTYELAEKIKKLSPNAKIILGGVHVTVVPEEALAKPFVDIVVRSEGELTFDELVKCIMEGKSYSHVLGISYVSDGKFVHNSNRPLIKSLDDIPPFPYHLFDKNIHRYTGFNSVQTSRGCPYNCNFCSQRSITGLTYRHMSKERAIASMKILVEKYGATLIRIMDDNIAANRKHVKELCAGIIEAGLHKKASFEAPMRGDNLSVEVLEMMKEANFNLVTFGLETTSERLMKDIDKGETVEEVLNAIKITAAKGISVGTTLIFGLPGETSADRWNAIRTVSKLPLASVRFNILTPYPGTPVYNKYINTSQMHVKKDWENFSVQYMWEGDDLPYVPAGTDRYELMFATMFANLWFYLKPSGLFKLFTQRAAGGNVIMLKKGWMFSPFALRLLKVGFYLGKRFAQVTFWMLVGKLRRAVGLGATLPAS
ncbi:MAG: B12-binding domain-containing radical SAM protein [Nitrospinae bacterium]|nr:B12-binding domain-containing radical SAM protein [Nitrospinota bacterium]MBF0634414.1 B12-binding domain-containing radical SAM protein [Nitrospinota bacterium]